MLRIFKKTIIALLFMVFILITSVFIWHKIASSQEAKKFKPIGEMVVVNSHKMHVYIEGESDVTLVLMAGSGTSSPVYDFKPLYSLLSSDYKIAVVEKAGYGYSEVSDSPRDIDTMLKETREALTKSGIDLEKGVVLLPHSLSGLEALYWAQQYPNEVKAIIGLDPAVPEAYDHLEINKTSIKIIRIVSQLGLLRLFPQAFEANPALKTDALSDEDILAYKSIFHRKTMTKDMLNEVDTVRDNADKVKEAGVPTQVPMYFFISDGKETGLDNWVNISETYLNSVENGQKMNLDTGHYVHAEEAQTIADEIKAYLPSILNE